MALQQLNHKKAFSSPTRRQGVRPASYMLLLSALDKGWRIVDVELAPAKDKSGLIYIITMQHPLSSVHQELILPYSALTEEVLSGARVDD